MTRSAATGTSSSERNYFIGMALAMTCLIFFGFAKTFFLRPLFPESVDLSPPERYFYLHGVVFSAWLLLFFTQLILVRRRHLGLHRKLGIAGAGLAVAMVFSGVYGSLVSAARPGGFFGVSAPPIEFMMVPLYWISWFAILAALGVALRRRAQAHKRLMLLATLCLVEPGLARMTPDSAFELLGPMTTFWLTDLFLIAMVIWDWRSLGRPHPATLSAGLAIVLTQPLAFALAKTATWQGFAAWAIGLVS